MHQINIFHASDPLLGSYESRFLKKSIEMPGKPNNPDFASFWLLGSGETIERHNPIPSQQSVTLCHQV